MRWGKILGELLVGLLAAGSLVTAADPDADLEIAARGAPQKTVQVLQACSTSYCVSKPKNVPRTTITKHVTSKKVVACKTSYIDKTTIADPKRTTTKIITVSPTRIITHLTVTSRRTVYTSTRTTTFTKVTTSATTITISADTTRTIIPPALTIPAPAGFTAIRDDPDFIRRNPRPRKRDTMPEPAPEPVPEAESEAELGSADIEERAAKYPKAVRCTKTYKTIINTTTTKRIARTTVKVPGKTTTKRVTKGTTKTIHYTPPHASTRISTIKAVRTVPTTSVTVHYNTFTSYTRTVTTTLPRETIYAACGARNIAPPLDQSSATGPNGWHVNVDPQQPYILIEEEGLQPYDCCAKCQSLPASQGKCIGSYLYDPFASLDNWVINCPPPDEEGNLPEPCGWGPGTIFALKCYIFLANEMGTCRNQAWTFWYWGVTRTGYISNGPDCKMWK